MIPHMARTLPFGRRALGAMWRRRNARLLADNRFDQHTVTTRQGSQQRGAHGSTTVHRAAGADDRARGRRVRGRTWPLSRKQWADLADTIPWTLDSDTLARLRGLGDPTDHAGCWRCTTR